MREQSKPVKISRFSTISTLAMILGIKEDLAVEATLGVNAFFFAANVVVSFIAICMCYYFDGKINEQFDKEWTMSTCPPRDIVLEFKEKIAKQGEQETIRVCSLPNPPPNCPERTAFLTPVRYPRPGLQLLLLFIIFSTVMAMFLSLAKNTMFAEEFFAILNYCSAVSPFKFEGYVWEYPVWFLILCGLILYHYTVYGLTLILIEIVFAVLGVQERITPVLVD
ncbi:unnamed protein product [Cylicocyclus nassatus]|uniref:Uncharacterized protein n=1 Tax=Cylicocyclus nassatus TaxID=53992 RepID=A0AA36GUA1_CYLNA|nr:unnamed protein product [Cylicocyclus nassatus]